GRVGVHGKRGALRRLALDGLVPPDIAAGRPRHVAVEALEHEKMLHRWRERRRLVGHFLHLDRLAAAWEAIGGDEHFGVAVLETAAQYHSGAATLRRWNASSGVNASVRMNLVRRARSMRSGVGRQMMSESVMDHPQPALLLEGRRNWSAATW